MPASFLSHSYKYHSKYSNNYPNSMLHPSMGELHRIFVTTVTYLVEVELPGGVGVELVGQ